MVPPLYTGPNRRESQSPFEGDDRRRSEYNEELLEAIRDHQEMMLNQNNSSNSNSTSLIESKITVKDMISLAVVVAGIITSWVNLNNNLTSITIKQEETFKYFNKRLEDLETQQKEILKNTDNIHTSLSKQIDDTQSQFEDLDRTVSKIYQEAIKRQK